MLKITSLENYNKNSIGINLNKRVLIVIYGTWNIKLNVIKSIKWMRMHCVYSHGSLAKRKLAMCYMDAMYALHTCTTVMGILQYCDFMPPIPALVPLLSLSFQCTLAPGLREIQNPNYVVLLSFVCNKM